MEEDIVVNWDLRVYVENQYSKQTTSHTLFVITNFINIRQCGIVGIEKFIYNRQNRIAYFIITWGFVIIDIGYNQLVKIFRQQNIIFHKTNGIVYSTIHKKLEKSNFITLFNFISNKLVDTFQMKVRSFL